MLINFISIKSLYRGKEIVELYFLQNGTAGERFIYFDLFCRYLVDCNYSSNTIGDYLYRVIGFLDYLFVGARSSGMNALSMQMLYLNYGDYLIYGGNSTTHIVTQINKIIPSPMISRDSALAYHSAITALIDSADQLNKKIKEYAESGIDFQCEREADVVSAIQGLIKIKALGVKNKPVSDGGTFSEKLKVKASLTAHMGVTSSVILPPKFFPFECIGELIESAVCHRDAALWALLAGIGVRESEADQTLMRDIKFASREVLIVNPSSRERGDYAGLSEREIKKLEWKGRNTPLTVFLEPYGRLFFEHLEQYLMHEVKNNVSHRFLFQSSSGAPLYLSDYCSEIYRPFVRAARSVCKANCIDSRDLAPHSLRHSYIYYMKNYVEHASGVGLDEYELMALTGHTSVNSLRIYAVTDYEKILEKIYYANLSRKLRNPESEIKLRVQYLEERLADFRANLLRKNDD